MHDLPQATLAAIVIVAVLGLIDVAGARRLRNWRRSEFTLAMVAFTGVAVLGVLWGVGVAIALSLLNFIRRAWRPHDAVLGRVDNLKGYHDTERYPDARHIPGLVLYRFDAPLFFANADYFRERVRALARSGDVSWIVVAAEPITDIDVTAGETLRGLDDELDAVGIELAFAELKDPVRDRLRRYGIETAVGADRFFPTVGVAVAAYLDQTGVDWLDWEDRRPDAGDPLAATAALVVGTRRLGQAGTAVRDRSAPRITPAAARCRSGSGSCASPCGRDRRSARTCRGSRRRSPRCRARGRSPPRRPRRSRRRGRGASIRA